MIITDLCCRVICNGMVISITVCCVRVDAIKFVPVCRISYFNALMSNKEDMGG